MKFRNLLCATLVVSVALSCSKSDNSPVPTPEPENTAPTISFIDPSADSGTLWNTVTVELDAKDTDGTVAKVEFFVNGSKESEATTTPYTFDWDSKGVDDGTVELKATVTDDEGDTATASLNINVQNLLLNYDVYDGYLSSGADVINFTYITSPAPDREILYVSEITGSSFAEAVQRPADFNGETFDVHFVGYYIHEDVNDGIITTYHGVTPGDFHPAPITPTDYGNELGEANVTFTDVPDHDYAMVFSGGNTNPIAENTERSFTVYGKFNLGYVYLKVGDVGYYLANPFEEGFYEQPLNQMNSPMENYTFADNGQVSTASLLIQGHTGPGRFSPAVTVYRENKFLGGNPFELKFHVPKDEDEVFDHYYTNARIQEDGKTYIHEEYNEILTSITKLNATFSAENKTLSQLDITATTENDFDFMLATCRVAASDTFTFVWNGYSRDDNISFPPIPTEVVEATNEVINSTDIVFKDANLTLQLADWDNYSGYNDYLDIRFGRKTEDTERKTRLFVFEQLQ
ncbi:MAG: Ig-like domain-containing protein [Allomuricauda sp.]